MTSIPSDGLVAESSIERVRDDVVAIGLPMHVTFLSCSFAYALLSDSGEVHLIDGGLDTPEARAVLHEALASFGRSLADVASVTITHLHDDHAGLATYVRDVSGAIIRMHPRDAVAARAAAPLVSAELVEQWLRDWAVPRRYREAMRDAALRPAGFTGGHPVDEEIGEGEILCIGDHRLEVMHVPGHTPGSIMLRDAARGIIYTGDHVLPHVAPGFGLGARRRGDSPLGDFLASLTRAESVSDHLEGLPGHGHRFFGVADRARAIAAHHSRRTDAVRAVLADHPSAPVWEIAGSIGWRGGWSGLDRYERFSALAQTAEHAARARASVE